MLDGVQAFPDTYRFEIALPEILEELFFFIELVFAEDPVGKGLLGRIAEGDLADIGAVVIVAEAPAGIVDDPGLVGAYSGGYPFSISGDIRSVPS